MRIYKQFTYHIIYNVCVVKIIKKEKEKKKRLVVKKCVGGLRVGLPSALRASATG